MLRFTHVGLFSLHTNLLFLLLFLLGLFTRGSTLRVEFHFSTFIPNLARAHRLFYAWGESSTATTPSSFVEQLKFSTEIQTVSISSLWTSKASSLFRAGLNKCSVITLDVHKLFCTINHQEEEKSAWLWKICAAFDQLLLTATGRWRASI